MPENKRPSVWALSVRLLHQQTVLALAIMFFAAVVATLVYTNYLQNRLVETAAINEAHRLSRALTQFRALYTSEVVVRAQEGGIEVTHDYLTRDNAIPLPATLSMLLGEHIGQADSGAKVRLYSDYPFPWRTEGGPRDDFERRALRELRQNSDLPFFRFEDAAGHGVLRYATADLMRTSCINCHNTHPDSPKTDWKVGDVRGVLEVTLPLDATVAQTRSGLQGLFLLLLFLGGVGLSGLAIVLGRLRRFSSDLEQNVAERTSALQQSEGRVRALVDAVQDAVISINSDGFITGWNPRAAATFGWSQDEVMGRPLSETIVLHLERDSLEGRLKSYLATGQGTLLNRLIRTTVFHRDGREIPVELRITPISTGDDTDFCAIIRDVTENEQLIEKLEEATQAAKEASQSKSRFLSHVNREIRTPMNTIIGYSEILQEDAKETGKEELIPDLQKIQTAGSELLSFMNNVVDASELEAGKTDLQLETVSVPTMIRDVVGTLQPRIEKDGNTLEIHCPENLGTMYTDATKVRRALVNLLSNAGKFTENGTITLTVAREFSGSGDWITVTVADSGIGIAPHLQEEVFESFGRRDPSIPSNQGGTGLGLAISRQYCRMMGGDITLKSELRQGATFTMRLPAEVEDDSTDESSSIP